MDGTSLQARLYRSRITGLNDVLEEGVRGLAEDSLMQRMGEKLFKHMRTLGMLPGDMRMANPSERKFVLKAFTKAHGKNYRRAPGLPDVVVADKGNRLMGHILTTGDDGSILKFQIKL